MLCADVEGLLIPWLKTALGGVRCVTDLPSNLQQVLPVVQITRISGGDDMITLDRAVVDVDVYAADRAAAILLAERVREKLRFSLPATVFAAASVKGVLTLNGPAWRPYDDAVSLRRFGATYEVILHAR